MKAKKSLGQNFLKSEKALRKIVEGGEIKSSDLVLEIGPGQGALTEKLLEKSCEIMAVEKDDQLYEFLKEKFKKEIADGNLDLIHADILDFDLNILGERKWKLIANIPYNITGAILKKFLSTDHQPEKMVLLVQKEVAERIVAREGKESILSLSVKAYGEPKYVEKVPAGAFSPMPAVDSAILSINGLNKEFFRDFSEENFFEVVKTGFSSKRKKLLSNLGGKFGKNRVEDVFKKLNLSENLRAEDVNLPTWRKITALVYI